MGDSMTITRKMAPAKQIEWGRIDALLFKIKIEAPHTV
jgi:hypothetical protein